MPFKKLLVPLDRSNLNHKVLTIALSLADRLGADVHVLRIRPVSAELDVEERDQTRHDLDAIEAETTELVRETLSTLAGHRVSPDKIHAEVRSGPVVDTIVGAAEELMADLIIMGTHGRSGALEFFTGSTTEQVVAKTPVSVTVVKPSGFPYLRD